MSESGREIITLQFGQTANAIGAHYFNVQNAGFSFNPNFITEVNHGLLFNEGRSSSGEFTFTPRLVAVDYEDGFKGIFSNFKEPPRKDEVENKLGARVELRGDGGGRTSSRNEYFEDVMKQDEQEDRMVMDVLKSKYDLEESIRSWPDYLTVPYCEKSVLPVPNYLTPPDSTMTTFQSGHSVWKGISEEFEESLRFQLEAADCIQGLHVLVDSDGCFSGMAREAIDLVKEECGKRTLLGWCCLRPRFSSKIEESSEVAKEILLRSLNLGYSFSWGTEFMDMLCPFSTEETVCSFEPSLRKTWPIENAYRSSAVLAVALELLTLSYRSRSCSSQMKDVPALLYLPGRKLLAAGLNWPYPATRLQADFVSLLATHRPTSLTPNLILSRDPDILNLTFKGFVDPSPSASPYVHVARDNIRLPRTFPDLLQPEQDLASSSHYVGRLRECSGMAGYFNTSEMKALFDQILEQTSETQFKKLPPFTTTDLEPSEMTEMLESVKNIADDYGTSGFL